MTLQMEGKSRLFILFPIVDILCIPVGIAICYGIALGQGHIAPIPDWPYVSDLGKLPPESCFFTFFFVWGAINLTVGAIFFFQYIDQYGHSSKANIAGLIVGFIVSLGLTMLSCFQDQNIHPLHIFGSILAFVGSVIYLWIIVAVTLKSKTVLNYSKAIIVIRIVLASLNTVVGLGFLIALIIREFYSQNHETRIVAGILEWILTYTPFIFIGTLIYDFRKFRSATLTISLFSKQDKTLEKLPLSSTSSEESLTQC